MGLCHYVRMEYMEFMTERCVALHNNLNIIEVILTVHRRYYVEIKGQLDATDDIYCRFYCMLNMLCVRFAGSLQTGHITLS